MCKSPLTVKVNRVHSGQREVVPVPCGSCARCISSRITDWQFRLEEELAVSSTPFFVTLTYNGRFLPKKAVDFYNEFIDRETGEIIIRKKTVNVPTLVPAHVTDYIKRLRYHYKLNHPESGTIKYYLCGEYGSRFKRPHYHIILLNCYDTELIERTWSTFNHKNGRYYPFGFVHCSPIRSLDAIGYCLKYLYKANQPLGVYGHKPFSRSSKGLGISYVRDDMIEYHNRSFEHASKTLFGSKEIPIPKYYKNKLFSEEFRFHLSRYLQQRADVAELERAERSARNQCRPVNDVLNEIFAEPFSEQKLVRRFEIM